MSDQDPNTPPAPLPEPDPGVGGAPNDVTLDSGERPITPVNPTDYAQGTYQGDPSVGIPGGCITMRGLPPLDDDFLEREDVREILADALSEVVGEKVAVEFGDEVEAMLEREREMEESHE